MVFLFSKQKTSYEMRISDWSSDVCSSDLAIRRGADRRIACLVGARRRAALLVRPQGEPRPPARSCGEGMCLAWCCGCGSIRSEERRVGKEGGVTCISRWTADNTNKKYNR